MRVSLRVYCSSGFLPHSVTEPEPLLLSENQLRNSFILAKKIQFRSFVEATFILFCFTVLQKKIHQKDQNQQCLSC